MIKVRGGTARSDEDLCVSCAFAVRREDAQGGVWVRCNALDTMLRHPTVECTAYQNKNDTDLWTMQQMAWVITGDPKSPAGFKFKQWKTLSIEERNKTEVPDIGI